MAKGKLRRGLESLVNNKVAKWGFYKSGDFAKWRIEKQEKAPEFYDKVKRSLELKLKDPNFKAQTKAEPGFFKNYVRKEAIKDYFGDLGWDVLKAYLIVKGMDVLADGGNAPLFEHIPIIKTYATNLPGLRDLFEQIPKVGAYAKHLAPPIAAVGGWIASNKFFGKSGNKNVGFEKRTLEFITKCEALATALFGTSVGGGGLSRFVGSTTSKTQEIVNEYLPLLPDFAKNLPTNAKRALYNIFYYLPIAPIAALSTFGILQPVYEKSKEYGIKVWNIAKKTKNYTVPILTGLVAAAGAKYGFDNTSLDPNTASLLMQTSALLTASIASEIINKDKEGVKWLYRLALPAYGIILMVQIPEINKVTDYITKYAGQYKVVADNTMKYLASLGTLGLLSKGVNRIVSH